MVENNFFIVARGKLGNFYMTLNFHWILEGYVSEESEIMHNAESVKSAQIHFSEFKMPEEVTYVDKMTAFLTKKPIRLTTELDLIPERIVALFGDGEEWPFGQF